MRADFEILEKSRDSEVGLIVNTSIFAIMGDQEETVGDIENWKKFTNSKFNYQVLPGNHFFIHSQADRLTRIINEHTSLSSVSI